MGNRPNIIFLMTDQQRFDAMGKVNPVVQTPNLDRLAGESVFSPMVIVQTPLVFRLELPL